MHVATTKINPIGCSISYLYIWKHKNFKQKTPTVHQEYTRCNTCTISVSSPDNCPCISVISSFEELNCYIVNYGYIILTVGTYGYETWSLTLREEYRQIFFENSVLRKIFGTKEDE